MPTIFDEYQRLKRVFSDPDLRQKLNDLWLEATNYEKREGGHWYKKGAGMGDKVSGFAFDVGEGRYIVSPPGVDHHAAYRRLVVKAYECNKVRSTDQIEADIFRGWLAKIEGWEYPLCVVAELDDEDMEMVEGFVLEKGIALPMNSLLRSHRPA